MTEGHVRPRLVVLNTHLMGQQYVLLGPAVTIGRSPECECFLDQNSVSRQHARLDESGGRYHFSDLNSRNGIKLWNEPVAQAELHHGDVISVGEVQLRFECPSQSPEAARESVGPHATTIMSSADDARPLTAMDIAGAAQPATPAPAEGEVQTLKEEEPKPKARANLGAVLAVLVTLALIVAGGVFVFSREPTGTGSRARPFTEKIAVREKRWVSLGFTQDFDDSHITIQDDSVAAAERYGPGQLLVTGESVGETTIRVTNPRGERAEVWVIVRGRLGDPIEALRDLDISDDERLRRGRTFLDSGESIEAEQPYVALQEYRKAEVILAPMAIKGQIYVEAQNAKERAEAEVSKRLKELQKEIRAAKENRANPLAISLLTKVMELIPDENDPRHQEAKGRRLRLIDRDLEQREKEKRGRGR